MTTAGAKWCGRRLAAAGLGDRYQVIGDQVATDGLLARRLGYTFLYWSPRLASVPLRPAGRSTCAAYAEPSSATLGADPAMPVRMVLAA